MTRYDEPEASNGKGGPHGLAGVPQSALDAATKALEGATYDLTYKPSSSSSETDTVRALDTEVESVAHAVLLAALEAIKAEPSKPAQCESVLWSGPGHQSRIRCTRSDSHPLDGDHWTEEVVHEWTGESAFAEVRW
jgi:hypothetical protein